MQNMENYPGSPETMAQRFREIRAGDVDPYELAGDLNKVEFKPEYDTGLGIAEVIVNKIPYKVHQTRNFPAIFTAADMLVKRLTPRNPEPIARLVLNSSRSALYREIFEGFKMGTPALYARMREVAVNLREQEKLLSSKDISEEQKNIRLATDEEKAEWAWIASNSYVAAADIARSIDPKFNLGYLYSSPLV
ncbi:hypothetical protein KW801_01725 [Candidatus Saccharibacteria bacterium]|nr:hypothetical protein [Candidatus Saccharibacteria bacterium]